MNTVNLSVFRRMTKQEVIDAIPCTILSDGEPLAVLSKAEDVIVIGDMHIRVRNQFKAREALIRRGMPKPEKL